MKNILLEAERNSSKNGDVDYSLVEGYERKEILRYNFHRDEIEKMNIKNIDFKYCSFREVFISLSKYEYCTFKNCSFITADIFDSQFKQCDFVNCVFIAMSTRNIDFEFCNFESCYFREDEFDKIKMINSNFKNSNIIE